MVRVSASTPAAQSAPSPPPTPDIGVASVPEQVPSAVYPASVQVPVVVNNFISVVTDEADLAQQRREFLARQREQGQGVPAPKRTQRGSAPQANHPPAQGPKESSQGLSGIGPSCPKRASSGSCSVGVTGSCRSVGRLV